MQELEMIVNQIEKMIKQSECQIEKDQDIEGKIFEQGRIDSMIDVLCYIKEMLCKN